MDNLLRQLRQSMAELSIQGEDFARQMWQMYEIFEEFLDTHIGWNQSITHIHQPSSSEETEVSSPCFRSQTNDMRETFPHDVLGSSDLAKDFYGSTDSCEHRNNKSKTESEVCNPLLETISTIESLGETDDYNDLPECYLRAKARSQGKLSPAPTIAVPTTDGDKDSIGYAGSNSIDSGYKSSCPTPDLSDGSVYGGECCKIVSGSSSSSLTRGCDVKPRIAMGTRVMHRQHQHPYGTNGPGFQDVNLDHLMYLRQTLISAMQHCESTPTSITTTPSSPPLTSVKNTDGRGQQWSCLSAGSLMDLTRPRRMPSPTLGSRQLRTPSPRPQRRLRRVSSPSLSTCSHTAADSVDTSGDVYQNYKFFMPYENTAFGTTESKPNNNRAASTSVLQDSCINNVPASASGGVQRNTRPPSPVPPSPNHFQKTVRFSVDNKTGNGTRTVDSGINNVPSSPPILTKSKPILKDPICANLRSHLEFSADDVTVATLEEEIDTLLYGRTTERRHPSSDSELPCSYVTMIEDKYRKSSVAKVKKLRDKSLPCVIQSNDGEVKGTTNDTSLLLDDVIRSPTADATSSPVDMKSRFSEVAKCMLEIIDDLQRQKMAESQGEPSSPASAPTSPAKDARTARCESVCSYDSRRLSGADYHVYEEIIYDLNSSQKENALERQTSLVTGGKTPILPPPLPRRPNGGFLRRSDSARENCDVENSLRGSIEKNEQASCQPKQRLNLYSLFRQQSDRRSIALSLEQEWRVGREDTPPPQDDDYGFRMVNHPM